MSSFFPNQFIQMKSGDEYFQRKAFSASKSVVCSSFNNNIPSKQESKKEKNTLKPCSSASSLNAQGKNTYRDVTEFSSVSTFHERLKALYIVSGIDYEKLFLYASQILEKLNGIISKLEEKLNNRSTLDTTICHHRIKFNLKRIIAHRDILKRQLELRCLLILKEECCFNLRQTTQFLGETKQLYTSEKLKMVTMPLQALNRFIGSTDISVFNLELLFDRLQIICGLQMSLNSSLQRIVNVFHIGFDLEIHQFMQKTCDILEDFKSKIFYWVYKNLNISIQKLCLVDSNCMSSEFLQKILEIYQKFSSLMSKNKREYYCRILKVLYPLFANSIIKCIMTEIPCTVILKCLSMFESRVAAEKTVQFLVSECKKHVQINHKKLIFGGFQERQSFQNNSTSDYFSVSTGEADTENQTGMFPPDHINSNFAFAFSSLEQKNQALVLQYLYAFTCLNSIPLAKVEAKHSHEDNSRVGRAIRQTWKVPVATYHNQSCMHLEKVYWINFWSKFQLHVFKLLKEIPHHQYGDSSAGSFILWPEIYIHTIVNILKNCSDDDDISLDGRRMLQQIYAFLYAHLVMISWDKRFSVALFSSSSHLCPPVPIVVNEVRTNPGNHLCLSLEPLVGIFSSNITLSEFIFIKTIQQLHSTMDCFVLWSNSKCRAFVSSWNISSYLLISYSDCKYACKILESMKELANACMIHAERSTFHSSLRLLLWNVFRKQISNLEGVITDAPNLIYKNAYMLARDSIFDVMKSKPFWMCLENDSANNYNTDACFAVEVILSPIQETMHHIPDLLLIVIASVRAVAEAFLDSFRNRKKPLREKHMKILKSELFNIIHWLDNLELTADDKTKLRTNNSVQKLINLVKAIKRHNTQRRHSFKRNNRVLPTSIDITHPEENLEESEMLYLKVCPRDNPILALISVCT